MFAHKNPSKRSYKVWILALLGGALFVSFGGVAVYQRRQLALLESRLEGLENNVREKRSIIDLEEDIDRLVRKHVDQKLNKRQVDSGFETFVKDLISSQVHFMESHCRNSSVLCFPGAKGERGDPGYKGSAGVSGPQGVLGVPGPKGELGPMGGSGPGGPKGDKGGQGVAGVKGDPGIQGGVGSLGPKGDKGDKGDRGVTGSSGPPGPKGDSGFGGGPLAPQPLDCCLRLSNPVREGPSNEVVHAAVGDKVLFPCKGSGYPPLTVTWTPPLSQLGATRFTESTDGLTLTGVQVTDNGKVFQCKLSNIFGSSTKQVQLQVTAPLSVSLTPTSPTFHEGNPGDIVLTCTFSGYPQPTVTWVHTQPNGQAPVVTSNIDNTVTGVSTLTIHNPTSADGGSYICRATNPQETKEATSTLSVSGVPHFLKPPSNQTVPVGTTITIKCDVSALPPATVTWIYPNNQVQPRRNVAVNPDNSLTITKADNLNEGSYTCFAKNIYGTSQATGYVQIVNPVHVTLTPSSTSLQNPYVSLECKASGDPIPHITWSKLDSTIGTEDRYITVGGDFIISPVSPANQDKDSGIYVCSASNGQTTDTKEAIVYKPLANVDCTTAFSACSSKIGVACGAICPSGCASQTGSLFGFQDYTSNSLMCKAAIQSGVISDSGGVVTWSMRDGSTMSFQGTTKNGVKSSSTGPIHNAASLFLFENTSTP